MPPKTQEEKKSAALASCRKYELKKRRETYMDLIKDCDSKDEIVDAFLDFFSKARVKAA